MSSQHPSAPEDGDGAHTPGRPTYREPHRVHPTAVIAGALTTLVWLVLWNTRGRGLDGYLITTGGAGVVAWAVALFLARHGDRGVAVGIALAVCFAWTIGLVALALRWFGP